MSKALHLCSLCNRAFFVEKESGLSVCINCVQGKTKMDLFIAKAFCSRCQEMVTSFPMSSREDTLISIHQDHGHPVDGEIEVYKKKSEPIQTHSGMPKGITPLKEKRHGKR